VDLGFGLREEADQTGKTGYWGAAKRNGCNATAHGIGTYLLYGGKSSTDTLVAFFCSKKKDANCEDVQRRQGN